MNDIIQDGHPTLREVAKEVPLPASEEDKKILHSLLEYVKNSQDPEIAAKYGLRSGIGLAAPQINVSKRMIGVHVTDEKGKLYSYALFNPRSLATQLKRHTLQAVKAACLSIKISQDLFLDMHVSQ